jgi:YidC/Oxa1 family membrane protein insertase
MEKRIFLAIVISIAFLFGWATLAPKLFPELAKKPAPVKPQVEKTTTAVPSATPANVGPAAPSGTATAEGSGRHMEPTPITAPVAAERAQLTIIDKPEYTAVLSNRGAQLISFKLKHYQQKHSKQPVDLVKARDRVRNDYPFALQAQDQPWAVRMNTALYTVTEREERGEHVVEYRYSDGRTTATKTFRFSQDPYLFDFAVNVAPPVPYRVAIGPGLRTLEPQEEDSRIVTTGNGIYEREGKFRIIPREKNGDVKVFDNVEYIGLADNYFLTLVRPSRPADAVLKRFELTDPKTKKKRDDLYAAVNAVNGTVAGQSFFGPKETKLLDKYGFGDALQFGWLGIIARFLLEALVWINRYTHNYGWAIIVLTIVLKMVLYPLQHKQTVSMKKMQRVQPKIEAIKAKYKKARTDPEQRQKMNVDTMQLYQKEGINPMAGCLPLVLQLPILWGFYNLLSHAIELRGADWMLWIKDLSEKDPTYILPILMTGTMFLQTYMMPATGDPSQRKMFLMMPLVFGFLFKDFPCGLVLYWLVQNILTIIQQWVMNKWWKDHPAEVQVEKA